MPPRSLSAQDEVFHQRYELQESRRAQPQYQPFGTILYGCPPGARCAPQSYGGAFPTLLPPFVYGGGHELSYGGVAGLQIPRISMEGRSLQLGRVLPFHRVSPGRRQNLTELRLSIGP